MLDVTRPRFTYEQESKISINKFRNPYLTKLTIKVHPEYSSIQGTRIITPPFLKPTNFSIAQYLPLWRNERLRFGLIWEQNILRNYNMSHFGLSTQYQIYNNLVLKSKNYFGSSVMTINEVSKNVSIANIPLKITGIYSGFFESSTSHFHTFSAGVAFQNRVALSFSQKLDSDLTVRANYEKQLPGDLHLKLQYEAVTENIGNSSIEASIGYNWGEGFSLWMKSLLNTDNLLPNISFQVEKQVKQNIFVGSIEYKNDKSVLYLGYKCPSFNLILPIFGSDSPIPAIIGAVLYCCAYFNRRKPKFQKVNKPKQSRADELRLISDKSNENYRREESQRGLLIEEVYVGQRGLLERFLAEQKRQLQIVRNEEYRNGIYDCTVSLRFYVQKGQLLLPKGNKMSLLGFYYDKKEGEEILISVRYRKGGEDHHTVFKQEDQILI